jgi:hypothetical protein
MEPKEIPTQSLEEQINNELINRLEKNKVFTTAFIENIKTIITQNELNNHSKIIDLFHDEGKNENN